MDVGVEVVRVTGHCGAGFSVGETFAFDGSRLAPTRGEARDCPVIGALLGGNLGRLRPQAPLYLSCPDPGTGAGGNVLFKVWGGGEDVRAANRQGAGGTGEPRPLRAEAVEVLGICPAGLRGGEEFPLGQAVAEDCEPAPVAGHAVCVLAAGEAMRQAVEIMRRHFGARKERRP
ncbi:MAG: hypothetical protein ACYC6I_11755 [Bacillota bacterium]